MKRGLSAPIAHCSSLCITSGQEKHTIFDCMFTFFFINENNVSPTWNQLDEQHSIVREAPISRLTIANAKDMEAWVAAFPAVMSR